MPEDVNLNNENPDNFDFWFQQGLDLFQQAQYEKAVEKFKGAESFEGDKGEFYGYWVLALTYLGQDEAAEEIFKRGKL